MSEYCTFLIRQGHPDGHNILTTNYHYHNRMLSANIFLKDGWSTKWLISDITFPRYV